MYARENPLSCIGLLLNCVWCFDCRQKSQCVSTLTAQHPEYINAHAWIEGGGGTILHPNPLSRSYIKRIIAIFLFATSIKTPPETYFARCAGPVIISASTMHISFSERSFNSSRWIRAFICTHSISVALIIVFMLNLRHFACRILRVCLPYISWASKLIKIVNVCITCRPFALERRFYTKSTELEDCHRDSCKLIPHFDRDVTFHRLCIPRCMGLQVDLCERDESNINKIECVSWYDICQIKRSMCRL